MVKETPLEVDIDLKNVLIDHVLVNFDSSVEDFKENVFKETVSEHFFEKLVQATAIKVPLLTPNLLGGTEIHVLREQN